MYRQIEGQVRLAIARGALGEGSQLPSVRAVSEELSVNPATVQKAWQELERQGLVEMRRGLGMFVVRVPGRATRDEARRQLDAAAARLAAEAVSLGIEPPDVVRAVERHMEALREEQERRQQSQRRRETS